MDEMSLPRTRKPFRRGRRRRPGAVAGGEPIAGGPPAAGEAVGVTDVAAAPVAGDDAGRGPRPQGRRRGGQGRPGGPPGTEGSEGNVIEADGQARSDERPPRPQQDRGPRPNRPQPNKVRRDRGPGASPGNNANPGNTAPRGGASGWNPNSMANGNTQERGGDFRRPPRGIGVQFAEPVRLAKLVSDRGLCASLREAETFVDRGWVIVNGERSVSSAQRVHPAAEVRLAPEARGEQARGVTILLNMPADIADAAAATALITGETLDDRYDGPSFDPGDLVDLQPVGEFDADAGGLLVLTQDRRVSEELTSGIDEDYLIRFSGTPDTSALARLEAGIPEADGVLRPTQVSLQGDGQVRMVIGSRLAWSTLRRLCAAAGLEVMRVVRVRIGRIRLGDLPPGRWRYLRDDENFTAPADG